MKFLLVVLFVSFSIASASSLAKIQMKNAEHEKNQRMGFEADKTALADAVAAYEKVQRFVNDHPQMKREMLRRNSKIMSPNIISSFSNGNDPANQIASGSQSVVDQFFTLFPQNLIHILGKTQEPETHRRHARSVMTDATNEKEAEKKAEQQHQQPNRARPSALRRALSWLHLAKAKPEGSEQLEIQQKSPADATAADNSASINEALDEAQVAVAAADAVAVDLAKAGAKSANAPVADMAAGKKTETAEASAPAADMAAGKKTETAEAAAKAAPVSDPSIAAVKAMETAKSISAEGKAAPAKEQHQH